VKSSSLFCWGSASAEAADFPPPSCLSSSSLSSFFLFSPEAQNLMDLGAVEGRRRVHARSEDVDVVPELAEALDQVGEADPHPGDVREGGRLCFVDFFFAWPSCERKNLTPSAFNPLPLFIREIFSTTTLLSHRQRWRPSGPGRRTRRRARRAPGPRR
jgi:hypothetical protein